MHTLKITIWDTDGTRLTNIQKKLYAALKARHISGVVDTMSEPPLLGRMNLLNRIPVLEVEGLFWNLRPDEELSEKDCHGFVEILIKKYGL